MPDDTSPDTEPAPEVEDPGAYAPDPDFPERNGPESHETEVAGPDDAPGSFLNADTEDDTEDDDEWDDTDSSGEGEEDPT